MLETKRKRLDSLRAQLGNERLSFEAHARDLSDFILPRRSRWYTSDANRGGNRMSDIIDSTATLAARTLSSGMMAGITSPARPWFRLTTPDPDLAEVGAIKTWLHIVSQRMRTVMLRSNLYNTLPLVYGDLGVFATAPMLVEEDLDTVFRTRSFPFGSYWIGTDSKWLVRVFCREFRMTVRQVVEEFGRTNQDSNTIDWTNLSANVKRAWDNSQYEQWVDVCHIIHPNPEWNPKALDAKYKRFASLYFERGMAATGSQESYTSIVGQDENKFLRESGYDRFPVLCPRWEVSAEDIYGTSCPGMVALGDIKALQKMHKRKADAVEKMVRPPLMGPASLRTQKVSILPGDVNYIDIRDGMEGLRPVFQVNPNVKDLVLDIQEHQFRIRRAFYEDLFLMLASSDRREMTAREVEERHEEKLLSLGPVLEQLNQDLLDPLVDLVFEMMFRQGMIPPAPEELAGQVLKVEYISVMAQAQKQVGISGMERFGATVLQLAAAKPDVFDKVDTDQWVDEYGDALGIPPRIIVPDEEVARRREAKAKLQAQQMAIEAAPQMARAAKDLGSVKTDDDSMLKRLAEAAAAGELTESA